MVTVTLQFVVICFDLLFVLQGNNFTGKRLDHQGPNGLQKSQFFVIAK